MAVHIPFCVLDRAENTLVLADTIDEFLLDEFAKHGAKISLLTSRECDIDAQKYPRIVSWKTGAIAALIDNSLKFDAIIDLRAIKPNAEEARALLMSLDAKGVLLKLFGVLEAEQMKPYNSCRYVIPCAASAFAPLDGGFTGFVFASKKSHPTADLKLQRADLLSGCDYYNADTHEAAFALPNAVLARFGEWIKS